MTRIATPGIKMAANQSASRTRCPSVRSSRRSIRRTAPLRTPTLASEATTPTFTSSVIRCCSTGAHYNGFTSSPSMEAPVSFELRHVAEADFPTEYGHFRIHGFEGRTGSRVEEAVVLIMGDVHSGERDGERFSFEAFAFAYRAIRA